jgi:hypothetical protein
MSGGGRLEAVRSSAIRAIGKALRVYETTTSRNPIAIDPKKTVSTIELSMEPTRLISRLLPLTRSALIPRYTPRTHHRFPSTFPAVRAMSTSLQEKLDALQNYSACDVCIASMEAGL